MKSGVSNELDSVHALNEAVMMVAGRFNHCILPIYGAKTNGRPYHIGTCILVSYSGDTYIVTARHIIKEIAHTKIYVGANGRLVDISHLEYMSADDDMYDYSLAKISGGNLDRLTSIREEDITHNIPHDDGNFFIGVGYPNSKNRGYKPLENTVTANIFHYSFRKNIHAKILNVLPDGGRCHLPLEYGKHSINENGSPTLTVKPQGMSGGAVFDVGLLENIQRPGEFLPKLSGMIIELKEEKGERAIVAVRFGLILASIRQLYG